MSPSSSRATRLGWDGAAVTDGESRPLLGVYVGHGASVGELALAFPGQGAQRVDMLADLLCAFPAAADAFTRAERRLGTVADVRLRDVVYPPPVFDADELDNQEDVVVGGGGAGGAAATDAAPAAIACGAVRRVTPPIATIGRLEAEQAEASCSSPRALRTPALVGLSNTGPKPR